MIHRPDVLQRMFRLAGLLLLAFVLGAVTPAGAAPPGELSLLIKDTPTGWAPQPDLRDDPPPTQLRAAFCPVFGSSSPLFLFPALPPSDADFRKWLERLDDAQSPQDASRELASPPPVVPPLPNALPVLAPAPVQVAPLLAAVLWYGPALFAIPPPSVVAC